LFAFLAEPRQVAQLLLSGEPLHVCDGGRLEMRPQERHFLRPQRLQLQYVQNCRRIFFQELLSQRIVAGLHDFLQVLDHPLADSRQLFELLWLFDQLLNRFWQTVNQLSGLFVTSIAAYDRAVNFQKLRRVAQNPCNLLVVHSGPL
jgi:hypothetical protein